MLRFFSKDVTIGEIKANRINMITEYYIDESGITGTDWLNSDQPYFIYGGWLIEQTDKSEIKSILQNVLKSRQGNELKSSNLFKNNNGMHVFSTIFFKMIELGAVPFFGFVEKRFMVAAKVVETFFDCAYNPFVNEYLTNPVELKRALASCIYEEQSIINRFSPLIRNGTIPADEMDIINKDLINCFRKNNHADVVKSLSSLNRENFSEMIDEFETVTEKGAKKTRLALTGTLLIELLKNIQFFAFPTGVQVHVYHDRLPSYDQEFMELCNIFLKQKTPVLLEGDRPWLSAFPSIKSFTTVDSKNELIIQAADLLCGFVLNTIKQVDNHIPLNVDVLDIFSELSMLKNLFFDLCYPCLLWNWYTSYQFEDRFFKAVKAKYLQHLNYNMIIKSNFGKALKSK